MGVRQEIGVRCYHCGDKCQSNALVFNEKPFCCDGCKVVYQILNENNLCDYYRLEKQPGITQNKHFNNHEFDYLEIPGVSEKLIVFKTEGLVQVELYIPEIHCSSCIWLLENLHKLNPGIVSSRVDFVKKKVRVSYRENEVSLKNLVLLLNKIGYAPVLNLSELNKTKEKNSYKKLYLKLGVAGFVFGNIMLLSFPEYLGLEDWENSGFKSFFGYLNIILAVPVLLYSANEYTRPAWKSILAGRLSIDVPITLGIIALFGFSIYNILILHETGYLDSFAGLIFFLLLGKIFQEKTYGALSFERNYESYFPISVNVVGKNKKEIPTLVNDLQKDDEIIIRDGELIPVDAELKSGKARVDYSFITGESDLMEVSKGDLLYAGGRQSGGSIRLKVKNTFSNSDIIKLWDNDVFETRDQNLNLESITNVVSRYFTVAVLLIAFGTLAYWIAFDNSVALKAFTSVLIVACPCALALSSPFTLGSIMRVFGRNRFFLRNSGVVERMAKIDTVVFDKTGTLTRNEGQQVIYEGIEPGEDQKVLIFSLAGHSNHPMSTVIRNYFPSKELDFDYVEEGPGYGIKGRLQGVEVLIGKWDFVGRNQKEDGTFISINGRALGKIMVNESFREDVLRSMQQLNSTKDLYVLSGDSKRSEHHLQQWFDQKHLNFNQTPGQKLDFIKGIKSTGKRVMMIGDGLNDAGALKASDVGIAINENVSNFSPACDAILNASDFKKLNRFFRLSAFGMKVIAISFVLSFIYNLLGLGFAVQGALTPVFSAILMPLSSISVVVFTTVATNLKAKKLKLL